jgi:osmotically-inducible protein OsmY
MTVIAMTREIGSRGMEVAAGVAASLGLKMIRSEIVADRVAERLGIEPSVFIRYMEGSASLTERWHVNRRKLVHYTAEEILRVAQQGNVLIKGWGAVTLLRDLPQVVEHEDARLYHVVLNTERLTIETCIKTIVQLAESPRFGWPMTVRSALADKLLETMIGSAMAEEISPSMAPLGVSVSVANGKVTLRGISSSGALRGKAETIAHTVAGVSPIDNRIVSVPSHGRF